MLKLKIFIVFILSLVSLGAYAFTYYDYPDEENWSQNGSTYCSEQKSGLLTKLKNAFVGQPMGFTPPIIEPSPYLNTYGPSYMRGYYGSNGWNNHNVYNPIYSGAGIHILD